MKEKKVYLVIGGAPQYHAEDDAFTEVFGVFSSYEDACQIFHHHQSWCGSITIVPLVLDVPVENHYISVFGIDNPPKPKTFHPTYQPVWIIISQHPYDINIKPTFYGIYSTEKKAKKVQDELVKESGLDGFAYDYPKIKKFCMIDLKDFEPDISQFIDKRVDSMGMTKTPFISGRN
jgi:hypothetical protein